MYLLDPWCERFDGLYDFVTFSRRRVDVVGCLGLLFIALFVMFSVIVVLFVLLDRSGHVSRVYC